MATIRVGTGSAWWGDRVEPARWNAERGNLDYLCFETMAEATISTAQVRKRRDADFAGYDTYLDDRMQAVLPGCLARAEPIVEALRNGADIVVTTRVADPSLFLAPMMYEFGWDPLDHARLGAGSAIGHILECGAQATGGYFSDPGFKDVPEPWNLGFPIAEVDETGAATFTKVGGTGGAITKMTVKEQMFYEIHDPANYITPDVVVDFTTAQLQELAPDTIRHSGITGKPRTDTLKVSIGCAEGFIGEDMFFYAGPGALRRAELAKRILEERFKIVGLQAEDIRIDFIGVNAIHGPASGNSDVEPYEVAVRVAARTLTRAEATKIGREVDGMAVSGVAMTGKRVPPQDRVREVIGVWSSLIPRRNVPWHINYFAN